MDTALMLEIAVDFLAAAAKEDKKLKSYAEDAFPHVVFPKVYKKTQLLVQKPEISFDLLEIDCLNLFCRLEF